MTKKDFIYLADVIRKHNADNPAYEFGLVQLQTLAGFCLDSNPRFNRTRWLDYIAGKCGPNGGTR
jgi:hypothetical protein